MSGAAARPYADPADPWELPCPRGGGEARDRGIDQVFPRAPRRPEDVPDGALETLQAACALEGLRQVFLVPRAVRATGYGDEKVVSPAGVLGIGARAVGLWTGGPGEGLKALVPLDRIAAIEDVTILLYGRLSIVSASGTLTVRYNSLGRISLGPALLELRNRLAGPPLPLPPEAEEGPDLPIKWQRLLRGRLLRLRQGAPLACRFHAVPGKAGGEAGRGQLLVVNPRELLYLRDPPQAELKYGEDSFIIPRARIGRVRARESCLEVAANGVRLALPMAAGLREAAVRWLGSAF